MISRILARLIRWRGPIIAIYAVLLPFAVVLASRIPTESEIDRLIVPSDPDFAATRAFQAIFPEPQLVQLVFESNDPWSSQELSRLERAETALAQVQHVGAFSAIDAIRRARPSADPAELRALALGTTFFRRQGLIGDRFITLIASLDVRTPQERDAALVAIDEALSHANVGAVRKIGAPYVTSWLEHESSSATMRSFAVFAVLLLAVTLFLYRSIRTLLAIVLALGVAVVFGIAAGAVLGFSFTIVSALVPLTIMVTTLATLTYLQSRFVDQPEGVPLARHQLVALRNKFRPVTASTVAAAGGFAALAVSNIRPIREMGLWTAVGLVLAWVVAYTLFPALQITLHTPTARRVAVRSALYDRIASGIPQFTYRHRWLLVGTGLGACIAGVIAVVGLPGVAGRMSVETDTLSNIDPSTAIYRDMRWFAKNVMDLNVARVWIHLPRAAATDVDVLRAIDRFDTQLDAVAGVTGVTGPTTALRMRSYVAGHGDTLPEDRERFASALADVEELLLTEPDLRAFIDVDRLADLQLTVLFRDGNAAGYAALVHRIMVAWDAIRATSPALAGARMNVVGESLLRVKVGAGLVPTLAESFALTAAFIFVVFVILFRSGTERILAMIPSFVALLVTFLGLRVFGGTLNVATIIIATTVLGTTENDQLHFFHHMHERAGASMEPHSHSGVLTAGGEPRPSLEIQLRHALRVSGRAVVFATLINAIGFLGLATSRFPPLRQFGLMAAAAFVLALVADFTILPAALWIRSGTRPSAPS